MMAAYDLFLADDRIISSMSKEMGRKFLKTRSKLIPIRISRKKNWEHEIYNVLTGTYMFFNQGTCVNIKIGSSHHSRNELLENLIAVVEQVAELIPGGWSNLQGMFIRTRRT